MMRDNALELNSMTRDQFIKQEAEEKILDIGAASAQYFDDDVDFDVVDIHKPNRWKVDHKCNKWIHGDAHDLPLEDEQYKSVLLCDILEHVISPIQVLSEAYRVTNSKIVITTPDEHRWHAKAKPYSHSEHIRYYNGKMLIDHMVLAGIPEEEIHLNHISQEPFTFWVATVVKSE